MFAHDDSEIGLTRSGNAFMTYGHMATDYVLLSLQGLLQQTGSLLSLKGLLQQTGSLLSLKGFATTDRVTFVSKGFATTDRVTFVFKGFATTDRITFVFDAFCVFRRKVDALQVGHCLFQLLVSSCLKSFLCQFLVPWLLSILHPSKPCGSTSTTRSSSTTCTMEETTDGISGPSQLLVKSLCDLSLEKN